MQERHTVIYGDCVNNGERKEDKRSRISFALIWIAILGLLAYLNHARMRPFGGNPDSYLWKIGILIVIGCIASIYVWWANRRDSK
jgi:membrane protein DedA with SNARE-associated domain